MCAPNNPLRDLTAVGDLGGPGQAYGNWSGIKMVLLGADWRTALFLTLGGRPKRGLTSLFLPRHRPGRYPQTPVSLYPKPLEEQAGNQAMPPAK